MKKFYKILKNLIWAALVAFLILVGITFIPIKGNYKVFTVQSGSMEPTIKIGSLIFVMPRADYKVGDIVTRKTSDSKVTVTHRIVEVTEDNGATAYITKGDANNAGDPENLTKSDIVGKMILALPLLGYPVGYAKTVPGLILLIVIPAVIIVYEEIRKIKKEIAGVWERRKNKNKAAVGQISFEEGFARPSQERGARYQKLVEENRPKRKKMDL